MYKYKNGNYTVTLLEDGTKIREYTSIPKPIFPESVDVKITNYCDGGCSYCHENSNINGKHADLNIKYFKNLPQGVEIAIGGGNPLSHPKLIEFLKELKKLGLVPNLTVNWKHVSSQILKVIMNEELIYGLGISMPQNSYLIEKYIKKYKYYPHRVLHFIIGIHDIKEIIKLNKQKILILGFKNIGRGKSYTPNIKEWISQTDNLLKNKNNSIIAFDNLAIKQLDLKNKLSKKKWNDSYMGDDGQFTMFIDFVNKLCYKSSFDIKVKKELTNIIDDFKFIKLIK